jgi:hypothetical protein
LRFARHGAEAASVEVAPPVSGPAACCRDCSLDGGTSSVSRCWLIPAAAPTIPFNREVNSDEDSLGALGGKGAGVITSVPENRSVTWPAGIHSAIPASHSKPAG